jgi:hypothetical protein
MMVIWLSFLFKGFNFCILDSMVPSLLSKSILENIVLVFYKRQLFFWRIFFKFLLTTSTALFMFCWYDKELRCFIFHFWHIFSSSYH